MNKYLSVFVTDWQNQFIYRTNFVLWRLRNVLRLLMTYFLWTGVFSSNQVVFGYDKSQIVVYIFMVLVVQTLIISAPSGDNMGGEISNGDLSNYLVKPINYLKYWFTRDLSSKLLNILFSVGEVIVLWALLRPNISISLTATSVLGLAVMCILGTILYYLINASVRFVAFWSPESTWGFAFIIIVFLEILAGGIFPLDVLPANIMRLLEFTPFPYLVYYPIVIFLGKVSGWELVRILLQTVLWTGVMFFVTKFLWKKGLRVYGAEGK